MMNDYWVFKIRLKESIIKQKKIVKLQIKECNLLEKSTILKRVPFLKSHKKS